LGEYLLSGKILLPSTRFLPQIAGEFVGSLNCLPNLKVLFGPLPVAAFEAKAVYIAGMQRA